MSDGLHGAGGQWHMWRLDPLGGLIVTLMWWWSWRCGRCGNCPSCAAPELRGVPGGHEAAAAAAQHPAEGSGPGAVRLPGLVVSHQHWGQVLEEWRLLRR